MKVLITGASGLIGSALVPALEDRGDTVVRVVRRPAKSSSEIEWSPAKPLTPERMAGVEAVLHLAGATIGQRWTKSAKKKIWESRVKGTSAVATAVAESYRATGAPSVMVSMSGVGYYGLRGDEELTEESSKGSGFLADLSQAWENATAEAAKSGVRVVTPRTGVVLSVHGGALKKMLLPFKLGLGGRIGGGDQWMSWIALQDLINVLRFLLIEESLSGAINAVAPAPVRNVEFVKALGAVLHRPTVFPMPEFAVKMLFGEMGKETLLASQRAYPKRLEAVEFGFQYPDVASALRVAFARGTGL